MVDWELEIARHLLEQWAHWLLRGDGYSRQSSIESFQQGGLGGGVFQSQVPQHIEPSRTVALVSRTLQHMQAFDSEGVYLLNRLYLREKSQRLCDIALIFDVGLSQFQTYRRDAERKFLELFRAIDAQDKKA